MILAPYLQTLSRITKGAMLARPPHYMAKLRYPIDPGESLSSCLGDGYFAGTNILTLAPYSNVPGLPTVSSFQEFKVRL